MDTKNFIYNFVDTVLNDFKNNSWCDLNFDLNTASYDMVVNQQGYLLKYFAAYFCDYYQGYAEFFKKFKGSELNVISIGCGAGIDYYALNRVIADENYDISVNYLGIDIIDWEYKPDFEFKNQGIDDISAIDVKNVDLIVFPKSLTELNTESLKNFANLICRECDSKNIFFLNSYITNNPQNNYCVDGINKFEVIAKILLDSEFNTTDKPHFYTYFTNQNDWLGRHFPFFEIPDGVRLLTEKLKSKCQEHDTTQPDCQECGVGFIPIFRSNYIAYNVVEFHR